MKLVKISLVLLALAFCMPAMAYKTARFQQGIANADANIDANYKMDFVCLASGPTLASAHFSNGYHTAYIGYEQDAPGVVSQDHGAGGVFCRWNVSSLRGKVKYIHSGKVTLWAKAATYDKTVKGLKFGEKAAGTGYKKVEWGYIKSGLTTPDEFLTWGDADPTTVTAFSNGISNAGATYDYFGTAVSNVGVPWTLGKGGPMYGTYTGLAGNPDGTGSRQVALTEAQTIDDDLDTSTVFTLNISQDALESWLAPEVRAYRGVPVYPNTGIGLKFYTAPAIGGASYPWEGYYFCDDQVDETVEATYHGPIFNGFDTADTARNLTPLAIRKKACRPLLEINYEEGTNVPVELSSFDVE